ncbi:MAG TPA: NAD(P)/FAD-dependent oxidoreductase [Candidatus Acidoferrum sp.]|nr:NAD(P)/FAD-dependent oxidoreductase [Candidatus Acidoferrum sp.]
MAKESEVLVIGAGPAGIASAIAARLRGFEVTVADCRRPPIDKACGEGLLPEGVAALRRLGVHFTPDVAHPFSGLRFRDNTISAHAYFGNGPAYGIRRTTLHRILLVRAESLGVNFLWGARLTGAAGGVVHLNREPVAYRWLVGADGYNSQVRKLAGLSSFQLYKSSRLGFRRHFRVTPWSEFVEVFWGEGIQIIVTPTAGDEVCLSLFTSNPRLRLKEAIACFPELASRLLEASPADAELGSITALRNSRCAAYESIALVGDASCSVDGVAGQGLSLAFQQALLLGEALSKRNLHLYAEAHHRLTENARRMTGLLLVMGRSVWIRRKILRLFSAKPEAFSRMIALHASPERGQSVGVREVLHLTFEMLGA